MTVPFDHNDHYHRLLLGLVPAGARRALDVGCGTGRFARRLASLGLEVDAIDRSAEVISAAPVANGVRYRLADVTALELPAAHYDFVSCLASIHHVPFETVSALRAALSPGGVLAILGCYRSSWPADVPVNLLAVPANAAARFAVAARERLSGSPAAKGAGDLVRAPVKWPPDHTLRQVRGAAAELLPGSSVRRLLFWRYLLVYRA